MPHRSHHPLPEARVATCYTPRLYDSSLGFESVCVCVCCAACHTSPMSSICKLKDNWLDFQGVDSPFQRFPSLPSVVNDPKLESSASACPGSMSGSEQSEVPLTAKSVQNLAEQLRAHRRPLAEKVLCRVRKYDRLLDKFHKGKHNTKSAPPTREHADAVLPIVRSETN